MHMMAHGPVVIPSEIPFFVCYAHWFLHCLNKICANFSFGWFLLEKFHSFCAVGQVEKDKLCFWAVLCKTTLQVALKIFALQYYRFG